MVAYKSAGNDMHCRARLLALDAARRTATIFLLEEGRELEEVSLDSLSQLGGQQDLLRPGLAIRVQLAGVPALPAATLTPAAEEDVQFVVRRCPGGKVQLCPVQGGEKRSLNEKFLCEALKAGIGPEALIQGFDYERLPTGPSEVVLLQFSSPQMLFVIAVDSFDR